MAKYRQIYTLIPHVGIRANIVHGDGKRFQRVFRLAWSNLPLTWRRVLLKYWREVQQQGQFKMMPYIELIDWWSDWRAAESGAIVYGQCDGFLSVCMGTKLRFWSVALT